MKIAPARSPATPSPPAWERRFDSFRHAKQGWLARLLLVAAVIIAYHPAWHAGFIWDDDVYVTENSLLAAPDGLWKIWFTFDIPSQYFPLTYTVLRLEYSLWGLASTGYHCVNILLHAVNALLVWELLRRLNCRGAWLAAAIWALHPVQVESVAWVTELKNVMMCFFLLLALLAWLRFIETTDDVPENSRVDAANPASTPHRSADFQSAVPQISNLQAPQKLGSPVQGMAHGAKKPHWKFYLATLLFYVLALFSKTTACTLPAALLLVLWWKGLPVNRQRLAQIIPFVVLGIAMGVVTTLCERHHMGVKGEIFAMSPIERLLVASHAIFFYAGKLFWPVNLMFSYPRWTISASNPLAYTWPAALAALTAVIYFARRHIGRSLEVATLFFITTLSPVLGFVMLYTFLWSFVADHYQYVADLGLIALAAAGIVIVFDFLKERAPYLKPVFCGALLLLLGALTWKQSEIYANAETLWTATIQRNPNSWLAHNNLGMALLDKGKIDDAMMEFERVMQINPKYEVPFNNYGAALLQKGRTDEAIRYIQWALQMAPNYAEAHNNLGNALLQMGNADDAITEYQAALKLQPGFAKAQNNLGNALFRKGDLDEALVQYQMALQLYPGYAEPRYNLGNVLFQKGDVDGAIAQYSVALKLAPNYAEARINLGNALLQKKDVDDAIIQYQKALQIAPDSVEACNNLGNAWLQKKNYAEAIAQYQKALQIAPDSVNALNNLAWVMSTCSQSPLRNGAKAVELALRANQLTGDGDPGILGTLATTYAEAGRFPDAIQTAQRAIQLAEKQSDQGLAESLRSELKLFQSNLPFHSQ